MSAPRFHISVSPMDMKDILGDYFSLEGLHELAAYIEKEHLGEMLPYEIVEMFEETSLAGASLMNKEIIAYLSRERVLVRK